MSVEKAAQAHTNLNMFAAIVAILEGGCIYPVRNPQRTAQKIIRLCSAEQTARLRIYDREKGSL